MRGMSLRIIGPRWRGPRVTGDRSCFLRLLGWGFRGLFNGVLIARFLGLGMSISGWHRTSVSQPWHLYSISWLWPEIFPGLPYPRTVALHFSPRHTYEFSQNTLHREWLECFHCTRYGYNDLWGCFCRCLRNQGLLFCVIVAFLEVGKRGLWVGRLLYWIILCIWEMGY